MRPMSLENTEKNVKELFPKKALDLDSFTQVIKTSKEQKNPKNYLNCFQDIEKREQELLKFLFVLK